MTRAPLDAFDDELFTAVASDNDLDADRLRSVAGDHQQGVRDLPGVDDIVYEWRNQFHMDPLVHRTPAAYVLALRDHVWSEFGDRLDLSATELDALRSLHDRQARTLVTDASRFDDADALVLTRP
jgi:hypothetical protein